MIVYPNDFFEVQMKVLLEDIEETWKVKRAGPEKEILQHYAEESRTFTIRYASKLPLFYNNLLISLYRINIANLVICKTLILPLYPFLRFFKKLLLIQNINFFFFFLLFERVIIYKLKYLKFSVLNIIFSLIL